MPSIDLVALAKTLGLIFLLVVVLTVIIGFIPSIELPEEIASGLNWLVQILVDFDFFLPVSTIWTILQITLAFKIAILSIQGFLAVYRWFRQSIA
jgi:hypothetical protein